MKSFRLRLFLRLFLSLLSLAFFIIIFILFNKLMTSSLYINTFFVCIVLFVVYKLWIYLNKEKLIIHEDKFIEINLFSVKELYFDEVLGYKKGFLPSSTLGDNIFLNLIFEILFNIIVGDKFCTLFTKDNSSIKSIKIRYLEREDEIFKFIKSNFKEIK